MTMSPKSFLSEILSDSVIPPSKLAYFRGRLSNKIHSMILEEFARQEKEGLTRAALAKRIGRKPEQVTRWLGSAGNWTLETLSDLALGLKCEPQIGIRSLVSIGNATVPTTRRTFSLSQSDFQVSIYSNAKVVPPLNRSSVSNG